MIQFYIVECMEKIQDVPCVKQTEWAEATSENGSLLILSVTFIYSLVALLMMYLIPEVIPVPLEGAFHAINIYKSFLNLSWSTAECCMVFSMKYVDGFVFVIRLIIHILQGCLTERRSVE